MLTASISTVLFNANPLMKFDGYYILSDLLEVPNLMQRSQAMLKFLAQRFIYRVKSATPPTSNPSEGMILLVYGVLSQVYRVFLFFSITLYVMGQMFAVGLFLAVWTAAAWFIMPIGAFVHWLATNQSLSEFRPRAIVTSVVLAAAGLLMVGAVPMPDRRRAEGVVESEHRAGVYFRTDGFVIQALKKPGEFVSKGDPIVVCESDRLVAEIADTKAKIAEARTKEGMALLKDQGQAQVAIEYLRTLGDKLKHLQEKHDRLTVRAPHDGVLVGPDPRELVGSFVREGQGFCEVVDLDSVRVVATLSQGEGEWLNELNPGEYKVELRRASDIDDVLEGTYIRHNEAATRDLPHPSLGFSGGGTIEVEQQDHTGMTAKRPLFTAYFAPVTEGGFQGKPGERVSMRFSLPNKPLMTQWVDRLEKLVQGRVKL
jgi:putative peptide zinc metalloprotease protein